MNRKNIFLFLLVIFSLKFFDAGIANAGILKNICYGYMAIAIIISIPCFLKNSGGFVFPVHLFLWPATLGAKDWNISLPQFLI